MPVPDEAPLTAVLLPRPAAAAAVTAAWDAGEAVTVLDPQPRPLRPRPCSSFSGPPTSSTATRRQALAGGVPVAGSVCAVVVTSGAPARPKASSSRRPA